LRKWLLALLLLASTLFIPCSADAVDVPWRTDHQLTTYWYTTDKKATIAWDANTDYQMGDQFEIKLVWLETSQDYLIVTTPNLTYDLRAPRVGHFEVFLRTVRPSEPLATRYSGWVQTTDPAVATVNGSPKGWILYWQMAAPGGVIIGLNLISQEEITNAHRHTKSPVEPGNSAGSQRVQPVLSANHARKTTG
jgi:hypothetical protein